MSWESGAPTSEVPLLLLALHGSRAVVIDDPAAPLGTAARHRLADDLGNGRGVALDCAGQRVTSKRPEADTAGFRQLTNAEREAVVVDHDQRIAAAHDR